MATCSQQAPGLPGSFLTQYEIEREERIRRNNAILESMGIVQQKTLLEAAFRIVKRPNSRSKAAARKTESQQPSRSSTRLKGDKPQYEGLPDDFSDANLGRAELPEVQSTGSEEAILFERRCDGQSRGSNYDSKAGITCHFCRQKKLCAEEGCPRCSERNPELECIGKSECSKCGSANGRFCKACLKIRYGMELSDVRLQMAEGSWLCPHCYEDEHPGEGWICNSSICMTRRGLKPTGIAIYDAQQQGFPSVAHYVQARMNTRQGAKAPAHSAKSAPKTAKPKQVKRVSFAADVISKAEREEKTRNEEARASAKNAHTATDEDSGELKTDALPVTVAAAVSALRTRKTVQTKLKCFPKGSPIVVRRSLRSSMVK